MAPSTTADARKAFGERLLLERRRQGRSQADVAAAMNTDQGVVSRAELGKTTIETQLRVAAELGIEIMDPPT